MSWPHSTPVRYIQANVRFCDRIDMLLMGDPSHRQPPQAGWAQPSLLPVFPWMREEDEWPALLLIASCSGMVGVELTNTPDRTQIIGRHSTRGRLSLPASEAGSETPPSSFFILSSLCFLPPLGSSRPWHMVRCTGICSVLAVAAGLM